MLEEYALVARPEPGGTAWPELPAGMRTASRFVLSPPPNLTLTKVIELPPVPRAQQERVVRFEAAQAIPRPLAELAWDWMPLGGDCRTVLLAATKLETAEVLAREAAEVGVRLDAIVPRAAALLRALEFNYPEVSGPVLVAELEGATALLLTRGSGRATVRLVGLPAVAPVLVGGEGEVGQVCGDDLRWRRLVAEASHLAAEPREGNEEPPPTLLLAGADAPEAEQIERIAGAAFARVARFEALRRVRVGPRANGAAAVAHQLGAVVGAAVGAVDRRKPGPNLLPRARQRENGFRRNRGWWLAGLGLGAAVAVVALIGVRLGNAQARREEAALTRQLQPWREAQRTVAARQRESETIERELAALRGLARARTSWALWLAATQERLGRAGEVWLEAVQPATESRQAATPLFGHGAAGGAGAGGLRLAIAGAAVDPGLDGRRALERVRVLLREWAADETVQAVEDERFDTSEPGVLRFACVLVLKPEAGP